jgi:DmsE family decaheme c-type cytochrome
MHTVRLAGLVTIAALAALALPSVVGRAQEQTPAPEQAAQPEQPAATATSTATRTASAAFSRKGADSCLACHDDLGIAAIFRTAHGRPNNPESPFGHGRLQCEVCHGPGGAHSGRVRSGQDRPAILNFGSKSATPAREQNAMCLTCHKGDMSHGWQGSTHERTDTACASCHKSHAASDPVMARATQPETCYACHSEQRRQSQLPHAHPIRVGKMACSDCHNAHGTTTDFNLVRTTLNETCTACHAEKRGPFLWEHAPVTEDCSTCHTAHGSVNPAMLTRRAPLLCQQCHSQAGHPSIAVGADGLPGARPSPYLLSGSCTNCHSQVHGSNHPSGAALTR